MKRPDKKKKPKQRITISGKNTPRGIEKAQSNEDVCLVWHTNTIDCGGRWCWKNIDPFVWWDHLFPARTSFSSMKWCEIHGDRHHAIPVSKIIKEAQERLREIEQDDVEELYSLAIGGERRIWGIRDGIVFKVLWWDPKHEIYPSLKRHT